MVNFGTDINRLWIGNAQGDLAIVTDTENAAQAVYNRLMTKLGELDWAEYINYGCQSWEAIGETNPEVFKPKIQLYIQNALLEDPRVDEIDDIIVTINDLFSVTVEITVQLIGEDTPTNIILVQEA